MIEARGSATGVKQKNACMRVSVYAGNWVTVIVIAAPVPA